MKKKVLILLTVLMCKGYSLFLFLTDRLTQGEGERGMGKLGENMAFGAVFRTLDG